MEPKESLKSTGGEERGKSAHFHPSFRGGTSVKTPVSTLSASSQSDSKHPVLCDLPKGLGSNVPQPDLSKAVSLSMGLYMGETDTKVMGNELGFPQQGQISLPSGETDFRLLEESIASLNKSSSLTESSKGAASTDVSLESEFPAMASHDLTLNQGSLAQGQVDTNSGNLKLFSEDQSTFDILRDLDLPPVSPGKEANGSPWKMDPVLDESSLLSPLGGDESFLLEGNEMEDCKPPILPDTKPNINECEDLLSSSTMQMPQVKTEKEDFIELCTHNPEDVPRSSIQYHIYA